MQSNDDDVILRRVLWQTLANVSEDMAASVFRAEFGTATL
jgi:hypothetical protein